MKKHFANILKLVISLGVGVGLVYWFIEQMSDSDKQQVAEDIKRANYFWVFMPPLLGIISNYFRTERWRQLLRPLGYKPRFLNTFLSILVMYFLNLFFPRLGEVTRCGILSRYEKVPLDKAIGTMVVERIFDVLSLGVVVLILIAAEYDKFFLLYDQIVRNSQSAFGDIIAKYQIDPTVKKFILIGAVVLIIAVAGIQIRKKGFQNIGHVVKEKLMGLFQAIVSVKDADNPWTILFHSVAIWVCYFLMGYTGFRMFPESAGLGLAAAGVCLFFSGVAFSLTPGGLGLYPIFMQIILGLYGVVGSVGISFGLVQWSAQTISVLLAGVISLILLAVLNKNQPQMK